MVQFGEEICWYQILGTIIPGNLMSVLRGSNAGDVSIGDLMIAVVSYIQINK